MNRFVDTSIITPYLWQQHEEKFGVLKDIISLANQFGEDFQFPKKRMDPVSEYTVMSFYNRAVNNLQGASVLLESGFGVQVAIITRVLFEDFVNLYYLLTAPNRGSSVQELSERYKDYVKTLPYEFNKKHKNVDGYAVPEDVEAEYAAEKKAFTVKYGTAKNPNDWSGLTVKQKVELAGQDVKDIYNMIYKELSEHVHGSPMISNQFIAIEGKRVTCTQGPSEILIERPMLALCTLYLYTLRIVAAQFDMQEYEEKAKELQLKVEQVWIQITTSEATNNG